MTKQVDQASATSSHSMSRVCLCVCACKRTRRGNVVATWACSHISLVNQCASSLYTKVHVNVAADKSNSGKSNSLRKASTMHANNQEGSTGGVSPEEIRRKLENVLGDKMKFMKSARASFRVLFFP